LNTFALQLPPLRERREDILVLARYFHDLFIQKYIKKNLKGFTAEAEKRLHDYNCREISGN